MPGLDTEHPGVFPARAGMIRAAANPAPSLMGIPRESGDDPKQLRVVELLPEYSPRERG